MNSPLAALMRNPPVRSSKGMRPQKSLMYDSKKEGTKRPKSAPVLTALGNVWDGELGQRSNHFRDWCVNDITIHPEDWPGENAVKWGREWDEWKASGFKNSV